MILLSEAAANQIDCLVSKANHDDDIYVGLRIEVIAGGCAGYQYKFDMVKKEDISKDDVVAFHPMEGKPLLYVDPMSAEKIDGATVDYKQTIMAREFVIKNPNATTTCGCGVSFQ